MPHDGEEFTVPPGDPDLGDTYYEHWLKALEQLICAKRVLNVNDILDRKEEWRNAYLKTPHGTAVELKKN